MNCKILIIVHLGTVMFMESCGTAVQTKAHHAFTCDLEQQRNIALDGWERVLTALLSASELVPTH